MFEGMEEIIQEKISADHLLYVSLKYTKTCDVIVNLLLRWRLMIEISINALLSKAKQNKKLSKIPENSVKKIGELKKIYKRDKEITNVIEFYEMLRKLETLKKEESGEFRKNVNLKIFYKGKEINVNLDKLKEYTELLEKFIGKVKYHLLPK